MPGNSLATFYISNPRTRSFGDDAAALGSTRERSSPTGTSAGVTWDVEGQAKIKFQPRHDQHTGQGQQEPGNRYRKTQDAIDKQYYNDSDTEDEMPSELPRSTSRTVRNLSGPRCGTVTRIVKTP